MRAVNLASGSDGNLTYIESDNAKILIDAGLSCKEIEKRLALLNVLGNQIDAILITHEHADHIKGLDVFASKYGCKVYAHVDEWETLNQKLSRVKNEQKFSFSLAPFGILDVLVSAFKLSHDSACCVGYSLESGGKKISIATDLGKVDENILKALSGSQLVFLEANHNVELLKKNPNYSLMLKQRILSNRGHLSNQDSAKVVAFLAGNGCRQVVLSHLSRENNRPSLAFEEITAYLKSQGIEEGVHIKIDIASPLPGKIFKII